MTKKHPEMQEGEVFYGNARAFEWDEIPYTSKRRGAHAYDMDGKELDAQLGIFPVFVREDEYRAGGAH